MNTSFRRLSSVVALGVSLVPLAHAHPGHDGHDLGGFTWDLGHLATHPLATAGCVVLFAAAAWAGWSYLRSRRDAQVNRVRR